MTPRDKLPKVVQPLLPERGIYAAGGGLVSSPWRIILTLEGDLRAGKGESGASFGALEETRKKVDPDTMRQLIDLGDRAWREERAPTRHPTADYDEIVILIDGKDGHLIEGYGPIVGGAAEELVARLRQVSWGAR